jgi:biotin carboxylase (EC 6.3.4.14)/acetyl-coenzyme A carboxylase carboxyl transferase subunit alpha 
MLKKILIANRGEIAVRVIRTCREMGIRTVAVYSEADRDSMHVKLADESICIGPPEPSKSYLDIPRLMAAVEVSSAEGVHPGYGFLSENPKFARIVEASGKVFIGPSPETLELIGDKIKAKEVAKKVGIPLVPGSDGPVDFQRALEVAKEIKYPVVIKSAGGGGGRGIRVVYDEKELREKLPLAMQEAKSAFGDERVYVEKYIVNPKHIEVQVLADRYGNVIALGERECSIQRRYRGSGGRSTQCQPLRRAEKLPGTACHSLLQRDQLCGCGHCGVFDGPGGQLLLYGNERKNTGRTSRHGNDHGHRHSARTNKSGKR